MNEPKQTFREQMNELNFRVGSSIHDGLVKLIQFEHSKNIAKVVKEKYQVVKYGISYEMSKLRNFTTKNVQVALLSLCFLLPPTIQACADKSSVTPITNPISPTEPLATVIGTTTSVVPIKTPFYTHESQTQNYIKDFENEHPNIINTKNSPEYICFEYIKTLGLKNNAHPESTKRLLDLLEIYISNKDIKISTRQKDNLGNYVQVDRDGSITVSYEEDNIDEPQRNILFDTQVNNSDTNKQELARNMLIASATKLIRNAYKDNNFTPINNTLINYGLDTQTKGLEYIETIYRILPTVNNIYHALPNKKENLSKDEFAIPERFIFVYLATPLVETVLLVQKDPISQIGLDLLANALPKSPITGQNFFGLIKNLIFQKYK